GQPNGVTSGKSNGSSGGSASDAIPNGSNIPKLPGALAGDTDSLPSDTSRAPSPPDNLNSPLNGGGESSDLDSGRCEDIAIKVRQLLRINVDAVVCLDRLIRVDIHGRPNSGLGGLLPGVLNSGGDESHRREICETIKANASILGITVDAVICLPEIIIRV
ncbi:hypothetical protein K7432_018555, partial [Basidiobolus ranarum]